MKSGLGCAVLLGFHFAPRLADASAEVTIYETAGNECPSGYTQITEEVACRAGMQLAGEAHHFFMGTEDSAEWPKGCYYCEGVAGCENGTWFNSNAAGAANGGARPYCQTDFLPLQTGWQVFIGDSDIDYWNTTAEYPSSYNLGYGGYTCTDMINKTDLYLATLQPSWLVMTCGENDIAMGSTAAEAFADFKVVVEKSIAAGARMLTLSTKPEPATTELHTVYQEYDALVLEYAKELAINASSSAPPLVIIDTYQGFLDIGNANSLYDDDELHLSVGYWYWNTWTKSALSDHYCVVWLGGLCVCNGWGGLCEYPAATTESTSTSEDSTSNFEDSTASGANAAATTESTSTSADSISTSEDGTSASEDTTSWIGSPDEDTASGARWVVSWPPMATIAAVLALGQLAA